MVQFTRKSRDFRAQEVSGKSEVTGDLPDDVQEALDLRDTAVDSLEASRLSEIDVNVREVEGQA